jgi:hypothetical protein
MSLTFITYSFALPHFKQHEFDEMIDCLYDTVEYALDNETRLVDFEWIDEEWEGHSFENTEQR